MDETFLRGELVRLAAANADTDAATVAAWSRDSEFQHLLESDAPILWTASSVKADLVATQGDDQPKEREWPFVIRALADDRLIGFVNLHIPHWSQRNGWIGIGLGEREYWGKGYGTDAMRVLLRFAFTELNLDRVTLNVFAYNERAQRSYRKAGFTVEGRQRERLRRGRQRYDMVFMGLLRDEWRAQTSAPPAGSL